MLLVAYLIHAIYGLMKLVVDGVQYVGLGGVGATEIRLHHRALGRHFAR